MDLSCTVDDLRSGAPVVNEYRTLPGRRVYDSDGCMLSLINWREKPVAAVQPALLPWCREHIPQLSGTWMFEAENLRDISAALAAVGCRIGDMHLYFLPDASAPETGPLFPVRRYEQADLSAFDGDERFGEAFAFDERHPDVLAFAAFDGEQIMGMAGASADGAELWQIGIDVLPAYRGRGVGANLTALLKDEILRRGKVPFYGTCASHIASQCVARAAGFRPAWVSLTSEQIPENER